MTAVGDTPGSADEIATGAVESLLSPGGWAGERDEFGQWTLTRLRDSAASILDAAAEATAAVA